MLMDKPIANVVFDMGGVLMNFDGPYFAGLFTNTPADAALLNGALFGSTTWSLLDSGTISHETMARVAAAHLPERLHPNLEACIAHWPEHSAPFEGTNELAIRLKKQGYGIYLLSNASTRILEQLNHMPAMPYLDGRVISAIERLMKPDPAIFRLLCKRYALDPATCLFVDDNTDNCAGARTAGMQAFHFTGDAHALETEITRLS
ncbi:HAD family hydrolase [Thermophilibacter immobilis]|jgi:putative hydrolase of the HAD superfamily|nr:HAD family phosphatase [Thermophilibacter immobilis]